MADKPKKILSEISPGELLDKISILEIKLEKIKNQGKLKEINKEYDILKKASTNMGTLAKLSPKKRNAYIIQELLKVDISKLNLSNQAITQIQTQFNMEKDELQKYINNLNTKINSLSKYQQKTNKLLSCVKKHS